MLGTVSSDKRACDRRDGRSADRKGSNSTRARIRSNLYRTGNIERGFPS